MDPKRFDTLTTSLGQARSRRTLLRTLGAAAVGALGLAGGSRADAAPGANSACAHFCAAVFGADTPEAGQCPRAAAHGTGLCAQCGPASTGDQTVCGTTCCGSGHECVNGGCFRIVTDVGICSACTGSCTGCTGGVVGSTNVLCGIPQSGTSCTGSAECPAGQACTVNPIRGSSFCLAPC